MGKKGAKDKHDVDSNAIVLRGGTVDEDNVRHGARRIDANDEVTGLSVQVWNNNTTSMHHKGTMLKLLKPIPNEAFALARAKDIFKAGGEITMQKLHNNPYHAVINGLTVAKVVEIFSRNQHSKLW
ncbi:MAG TPA: hypothetical protein VIL36_24520 [Acidimicrobiales bacterium]